MWYDVRGPARDMQRLSTWTTTHTTEVYGCATVHDLFGYVCTVRMVQYIMHEHCRHYLFGAPAVLYDPLQYYAHWRTVRTYSVNVTGQITMHGQSGGCGGSLFAYLMDIIFLRWIVIFACKIVYSSWFLQLDVFACDPFTTALGLYTQPEPDNGIERANQTPIEPPGLRLPSHSLF